jgi:hypothetical protein
MTPRPPCPPGHASPSRGPRIGAAALVLVLLSSCGGCRGKTDAERAAQERAEIERKVRDSYILVPYRALKLTLRSEREPNVPPELAVLWRAVDETRHLPEKAATEEEARRMARIYLDLGVAFYKARKLLQQRDEDEFPLLWTKLLPDRPAWPGYDAGQEHAALASIGLLISLIDRNQRVGGTDVVFYELSRATPQPTWSPLPRVIVRASRGLAFCTSKYHYAAEEELNAFLSETESLPADEFPNLWQTTSAQFRETLLAAGYFLRAWNRMGLKRERAAEDDIERGLGSLERLGVENELTWWGWSFLHFRRERYEESARYLDKLAASPYLGEKERQEVRASAEEMRRQGNKLPVFRQARAALILGQALVARAGGLEQVLVTLVGPERAQQLYAPLTWMERVRQRVGEFSTERLASEAGETLDKARDLGGKGLEALKQKLGGGAEGTAETSPQ